MRVMKRIVYACYIKSNSTKLCFLEIGSQELLGVKQIKSQSWRFERKALSQSEGTGALAKG